ncbi:UNVERIFIED_CONTAM: hypothetical protein RMT77_001464 [Armadillidium vulgare]
MHVKFLLFVCLIKTSVIVASTTEANYSTKEGPMECHLRSINCHEVTDNVEEIKEIVQHKLQVFNSCLAQQGFNHFDRNEKIVTMRPEINSNSTERKNDNNDGMRILCHEDPLEKWENLTEIIDEQVIATLQCCYGRGIHMYDTNSNINTEFFISEAEKRLEGEVLSSYLSGINICAQYVTDCDVKFFRKCVEEECASLITF